MLYTRAQLITEIERFYIRGDIADATWHIFMDLALEHAANKYNWLDLKGTHTYNTVADTETVALNASPGVRILHSVRTEQTSATDNDPLTFLPYEEYQDRYRAGTSATGVPKNFSVWGRTLYLQPIPDDAYTLRTWETRFPTKFVDGTDSTASPIINLDTYLIHYATGWAYLTKQHKDYADTHFKIANEALLLAKGRNDLLIAQNRTPSDSAYEITLDTRLNDDYERQ